MSDYLHGYIKRSGFHHGMALMILVLIGVGVFGWFMTIQLDRVIISGAESAVIGDIETLAAINPGEKLFRIDKASLIDRVESHPWVLSAHISRFPTGTLRIGIVERKPIVLVLNASGNSVFYLDREGIRLPFGTGLPDSGRPYDVPIFHGYSEGFAETGETESDTVKEFLKVLADDRDGTGDMISEVRLDSKKIELRLEPLGNHGAVPVSLGSSEFEEKFNRLHAFWYQAMLPGQDQEFGWVDLRYDSQIVVRDASP